MLPDVPALHQRSSDAASVSNVHGFSGGARSPAGESGRQSGTQSHRHPYLSLEKGFQGTGMGRDPLILTLLPGDSNQEKEKRSAGPPQFFQPAGNEKGIPRLCIKGWRSVTMCQSFFSQVRRADSFYFMEPHLAWNVAEISDVISWRPLTLLWDTCVAPDVTPSNSVLDIQLSTISLVY